MDGDGFVVAKDALLVINYLNELPATGSGEGEDADVTAYDAGTVVADVSTGDWMQAVAQMAVPMIETKVDDQEEEQVPVDAFFATMTSDDDEVVIADPAVQRGSTVDDVLMSMTSAASEIAEEVVANQAGWMMRQRLASAFRK